MPLVASAAVAGLEKFLGGFLPAPELPLQAINFILSISITTALFAAMCRSLPNTQDQVARCMGRRSRDLLPL